MSATSIAAIILAAGKGTRMVSDLPKVMHKVAGFPLINHVISACEAAGANRITPVIAPGMDDVQSAVTPYECAFQAEQKGTGHAALCAKEALGDHHGPVLILLGDAPLISADTLTGLIAAASKSGLAVLGFETEDPQGYGRIALEPGGAVAAIIEDKDCTPQQQDITLCNSGAFCAHSDHLFDWLSQIDDDNAQGEIYLTDLVTVAAKHGVVCHLAVCSAEEAFGINTRAQLAQVEYMAQSAMRDHAMESGVTLIDPESVYFSADTVVERDVIIEPNVFIAPGVTLESGATIHANSVLEGCIIRRDAEIGPFARIRPKSDIGEGATIGNFCEVNRSTLKSGAKSKHLSYLGDAEIGSKANIGAGTVIANYDGKNKHKTSIGDDAFVGSNATLVAPVTTGNESYIGAGSVITGDVPEDALGVSRAKPRIIENWSKRKKG